jgi:hypothetical protein
MWRLLLATLLTLTNTTIFASGSIGVVSDNKGSQCEVQRGKTKTSGVKGASIESMDTYITQACASNITFKDDTKVKITENSKLVIDDFVFDAKQSDAGKLAMKVTMGTVRYASGQIAKNNPQQVAVKTPTATIAVRGTDFSMTVDETGQSLVVLLPSCKEESEQKKYELEENRCKVGQIAVSNAAGTVVLDKAFEATYITSVDMRPTAPTVINTIESKINNNLIIVRPLEVERAIRDNTGRTKREELEAEIEAEAARRLAQRVRESGEEIERARILALAEAAGKTGCNASTNICVTWANPEAQDIQSRGRGIAFRINEDHYAEVKTQGYSSNTAITIVHNDASASELIGVGGSSGNNIYIKQNLGVLRR